MSDAASKPARAQLVEHLIVVTAVIRWSPLRFQLAGLCGPSFEFLFRAGLRSRGDSVVKLVVDVFRMMRQVSFIRLTSWARQTVTSERASIFWPGGGANLKANAK